MSDGTGMRKQRFSTYFAAKTLMCPGRTTHFPLTSLMNWPPIGCNARGDSFLFCLRITERIPRQNLVAVKDSRHKEQVKDSKHNEKVKDSRHNEQVKDSRHYKQVKDSRHNEQVKDSRHNEQVKGSRHNEQVKDSRHNEQVKDSRHNEQVEDFKHKDRHEEHVKDSIHKEQCSSQGTPRYQSPVEQSMTSLSQDKDEVTCA
eukprot:3760046-Pleurochrysis_carterae.AAC.1